jgi:hypothetical protein
MSPGREFQDLSLSTVSQIPGWKTEARMKGLMISAFMAVALLAAVAVTHSRPTSVGASLGAAAMPSLLELHYAANVNKLPAEEMEDQALVFPAKPQ